MRPVPCSRVPRCHKEQLCLSVRRVFFHSTGHLSPIQRLSSLGGHLLNAGHRGRTSVEGCSQWRPVFSFTSRVLHAAYPSRVGHSSSRHRCLEAATERPCCEGFSSNRAATKNCPFRTECFCTWRMAALQQHSQWFCAGASVEEELEREVPVGGALLLV